MKKKKLRLKNLGDLSPDILLESTGTGVQLGECAVCFLFARSLSQDFFSEEIQNNTDYVMCVYGWETEAPRSVEGR